jgi:hypothetical protein
MREHRGAQGMALRVFLKLPGVLTIDSGVSICVFAALILLISRILFKD